MITGYLRPQLFIREVLQQLPNQDSVSLHAFVFGPQFDLFRYTNATERAAMTGTAFAYNTSNVLANRQVVPYQGIQAYHVVDLPFVNLFAENLEGGLFDIRSGVATTLGNTYNFAIPSLRNPNQLVVTQVGASITANTGALISSNNYQLATVTVVNGGTGYTPSSTITVPIVDPSNYGSGAVALLTVNSSGVVASGVIISPGSGYKTAITLTIPGPAVNVAGSGTLAPELYGRAVTPGDVLYASLNGTTVRRIVQSVTQQVQPASVGTGNNQQFVAANTNPAYAATASFVNVSAPYGWTTALAGGHAASDWSGLVQGSYYQGKYGDNYIITCTTGGTTGALFRVRTASGAFSADNIAPSTISGNVYTFNDASLGGLVITLTGSGQPFQIGQQFGFTVFGAYEPLVLAPTGQVTAVAITAGGSGYSAGNLIISAPPAGGVQATGTYTVSGSAINAITITNPGSGYLYPPLITAAVGTGAVLQAAIATSNNSCDLALVAGSAYNGTVNNRYVLTVVQGDTAGARNSFTNALVRVQDTAGVDVASEITVAQGSIYNLGSYGLQFTFPSNMAKPSGGTGTAATATLSFAAGTISGATITQGSGYYAVPPVVTIASSHGGTGTATAVLTADGLIEDILFNVSGTWASGDTISIAAPVTYQAGLRTGDIYYIDVVAPAVGGAYNTIVLPGAVCDITGWAPTDPLVNLFNVKTRTLFTGAVPQQGNPANAPVLSWTASQAGITVAANLQVFVPGRSTDNQWVNVYASSYANFFAHWRGLVPASAAKASPTRYYSTASIISTFGANDLDNPVCFAACIAFNAAQGKSIFVSSLATNDINGYTAILNQAARIQGPYALVPTTQDAAVIDLLQTHVDTCSLYNKKLWRRAYVSQPTGGEFAVYQTDASSNPLLAQILTNGAGNVRVLSSNAQFVVEEVQPGDTLRVNFVADSWGNSTYSEYTVQSVLENDELVLVSGPSAPITPAVRIEIWRPATGTNLAQHMGTFAETLNDRRMCVVWSDSPTILDTTGTVYLVTPGWNLCAEIAGLRSALLPQQGLTYTQMQYSVVAAPNMYTVYQDSDLDLAASMGVMIVTQELAGGPIFIRHQLTTDVNDGSLYYEDSVGTNFDNIAYTMKAILQPYIGQRNATPQVVEELDVRIKNTLDSFKLAPAGFSEIGPAIIDWSNLTVAIDSNFRDRIIASATVQLPLPLNIVDLTLYGTTLDGSVSITTANSTPVSTNS